MDGLSVGRRLYGRRIRTFRSQAGLSLSAVAAAATCAKGYLSQIENGTKLPDKTIAESIDTALEAGGELMADWWILDTARRQRPTVDTTHMSRGDEEDDVERRLLLQRALGVTAAAGVAGPLEGLEAIRHTLDDVVGERALEDWEQLAWDYGHDIMTAAPADLLEELGQDALAVRRLLGRTTNDHERAGLQRVAAQLAFLVGATLDDFGEPTAARRWYRTAVAAADSSGDHDLRVWVRGSQARSTVADSPQRAMTMAARTLTLADDHHVTGAGRAQAVAARAHALALLNPPEAVDAADALNNVFDTLPATVKADRNSTFGWSELELRGVHSLVYSRTGDARAAAAHDERLAALPAGRLYGLAKTGLDRALWLVRSGDPTEGLRHATQVVTELPPQHRISSVLDHARDVERALPAGAGDSRAAVEYRELLALPSGN